MCDEHSNVDVVGNGPLTLNHEVCMRLFLPLSQGASLIEFLYHTWCYELSGSNNVPR